MFEEPRFLFHLGKHRLGLVDTALTRGFADGCILSPVDFNVTTNREIASTVNENDGLLLFDPQFYYPRSNIEELHSHRYFSEFGGAPEGPTLGDQDSFDTKTFNSQEKRKSFCEQLVSFQDELGVDAFISPSRYLQAFSDGYMNWWADLTEEFLDVAKATDPDKPVLASLPLAGSALTDDTQPGRLLNKITGQDVDGFYTTLSVPQYREYPLNGTDIIESYLTLIWHLKRSRYRVLVGHSHHVGHLFLGAGADAFASGIHKKLKTLDMSRFRDEESSGGQMVMNYYSEPLLNELRALSPAMGGDDDEDMAPAAMSDIDLLSANDFDVERIRTGSPVEGQLFRSGVFASETNWGKVDGEGLHFLYSCKNIADQYREDELIDSHEDLDDIFVARAAHTRSRISEATELFEEISDLGINLSQPNRAIYTDWDDAFETIEERFEE